MAGLMGTDKSGKSHIWLDQLAHYYDMQDPSFSKVQRLVQAILGMTEAGYWVTGDKIPSESQMTEALPVGLATVQSALRKLTEQGLIQRKRKAGSFIADPGDHSAGIYFYGFFEEEGDKPLPLRDVTLALSKVSETGPWSRFLGDAPFFIRISRIMSVGDGFRIMSHLFLHGPDYAPLLEKEADSLMNVTFRHYLRDEFGVVFGQSDAQIAFTELDEPTADALGADLGETAMRYDIFQHSIRGDAISYMQTIIPKNEHRLQLVGLNSL